MTIRPFDRRALRSLDPPVTPGLLRSFAVACFAMFACSVLAMPAIEDTYDPVRQSISEGVLQPRGYIQVAGLAVLALGEFALAGALCRSCTDRLGYGTAALVACSAAFVVMLAILPTDYHDGARSLVGRVHSLVATFSCVAMVAAMICASLTARFFPRLLILTFALTLLVVGLCMTFDIGARGLVQRIGATFLLTWLMLIALTGSATMGERAAHELDLGLDLDRRTIE